MAAPADEPADAERLQQLAGLRSELDRVDDALHDLLMRRAEVVAQVGALGAKGRVPLRPGREASIIRRLLGRNRGALEPATLVRVWREMLAGSSAQQSPMVILAADAGLDGAVKEHFGALSRAKVAAPVPAIAAVRQGEAALAVLRLPSEGERWWRSLIDDAERWPRAHIVARLPFWGRAGVPEAMVISVAAPDPSGADRTVIACGEMRALSAAGFTVGGVFAEGLAEIDGFVTQEDPRLRGIPAWVLGAYAVPVGDFT